MPLRHPAVKNLPVALVSLIATFAFSIAIFFTACGGRSSANEWTWVSGINAAGASGVYETRGLAAIRNVAGVRYSWTDNSGDLSEDQSYASNRTGGMTGQHKEFREFSPATEVWSWVSGSSAEKEIYVAGMPELNASANPWSWVSGSNGGEESASSGTQGVVVSSNGRGAGHVSWISRGNPGGDDLQASVKDLWSYAP